MADQLVGVPKGLQMFRAPVGLVVLFFVLVALCAMSANSEIIPSASRKLIFAPVSFNCPGKIESPIIEGFDGLLEDLSLVFSGVRGISFPATDLTGPTWKSPRHFERVKSISGADLVLTIRLRCSESNTVIYHVTARTLPENRLIASAQGSAGALHELRNSLIDEMLGILGLGDAIDSIHRTTAAVLDKYLQGNDVKNSLAARARLLREATRLDRGFSPAWTRLGEVELNLGEEGGEGFAQHFHAAERALKHALSGSPNAPAAVHALASVFMRTGRTAAAIETLRTGVERRPDSAVLHAKLGYAFRYAGMLDRSIAEYRLAQKLDSGFDNLVQCERQVIKALIYSGRSGAILRYVCCQGRWLVGRIRGRVPSGGARAAGRTHPTGRYPGTRQCQ